jgi:hypothetical protein
LYHEKTAKEAKASSAVFFHSIPNLIYNGGNADSMGTMVHTAPSVAPDAAMLNFADIHTHHPLCPCFFAQKTVVVFPEQHMDLMALMTAALLTAITGDDWKCF